MRFRLDSRTYEKEFLPVLGVGQFGEVFDLGQEHAAKIYHDKPEEFQLRKLMKLFDIGSSIAVDREVAKQVAMPLRPAIDTADDAIAGFSMNCFRGWIKLSKLTFAPQKGEYWRHEGFQFSDDTAIAAVFDLFAMLGALARSHIAIGDISLANILIDPRTGKPGFIDMDAVQFEDWESDSQGTEGYVDPSLLDADLNASGGYHFDAKTDVFALTVVSYFLVTGCNPFHLQVLPPVTSSEVLLRKKLSNLRLLIEGDACLHPHGMRLAPTNFLTFLKQRLDCIRRAKGRSGNDGELLYQHFVDVFVENGRENLLEVLEDDDARSPEHQMLAYLRTKEVIRELKTKYGLTGQVPTAARKRKPFIARDPRGFDSFLASRGIELGTMVS
jgi:serine/threonine protein kinase